MRKLALEVTWMSKGTRGEGQDGDRMAEERWLRRCFLIDDDGLGKRSALELQRDVITTGD